MRKSGIFILFVTVALVLAACGGGGTTAPPAQTTPPTQAVPVPGTTTPETVVIDAAKLYATNCAACHSADRKGVSGLGPALTPTSLASKSLDNIEERITEGKSGTAMPAFEGKLTHEEIDAIADFIKTVQP